MFPRLPQLIAGTSKFAGLLDKKNLLPAHLIRRRPLAAHLIRRRPLAAHLIKRPPLAVHLMKRIPLANQRMKETLLWRSRSSREKRQAGEPKEGRSIRGKHIKGIRSQDKYFYIFEGQCYWVGTLCMRCWFFLYTRIILCYFVKILACFSYILTNFKNALSKLLQKPWSSSFWPWKCIQEAACEPVK